MFTRRNFAADVCRQNLKFTAKIAKSLYTVHLWLDGKRVVDFLLALIELFSLALTVEEV